MGNGRETKSVDGRAIRAWGGQGEACLSVSNCIFGGQMYKSNATETGSGSAIYAANLARLTVDDSLFVTRCSSHPTKSSKHFFPSEVHTLSQAKNGHTVTLRLLMCICFRQ